MTTPLGITATSSALLSFPLRLLHLSRQPPRPSSTNWMLSIHTAKPQHQEREAVLVAFMMEGQLCSALQEAPGEGGEIEVGQCSIVQHNCMALWHSLRHKLGEVATQ
jgi:hypothetical protein